MYAYFSQKSLKCFCAFQSITRKLVPNRRFFPLTHLIQLSFEIQEKSFVLSLKRLIQYCQTITLYIHHHCLHKSDRHSCKGLTQGGLIRFDQKKPIVKCHILYTEGWYHPAKCLPAVNGRYWNTNQY